MTDADTIRDLTAEVVRLETENASLRNIAGDNACHLTQTPDEAAALGIQLPPWSEFGESCRRFHAQVTEKAGALTGCMTIAQLEATVADQAERLRVAEEALAPFANYAHALELIAGKDRSAGSTNGWSNLDPMLGAKGQVVTMGHFRKADAALAKIREGRATVKESLTVQPEVKP